MKWIYAGFSDINLRSTNMDSLLIAEHTIEGIPVLLAVVCDGVGSTADGAYASAFATKAFEKWLYAQTCRAELARALREKTLAINQAILTQMKQKQLVTASTLVALLLTEDRFFAVQAGDSRIYMIEDDRVCQLMRDDTSEDGRLRQYLGYPGELQLQCMEGRLESRAFLMCTDGFYKKMSREQLVHCRKTKRQSELEALLARMRNTIKHCGEKDNISAVIIKTKG